MTEPLVSIIIPTYNRGNFIEAAIKSALSQSYNNIEVIICDNDSSDNTRVLVEKIKNEYKNKKIYFLEHYQNIGPVKNWFSGIKFANGEFMKFLFSDDLIYPNCISDLIKPMLQSNYAFSYGVVENLWMNSKITSYRRFFTKDKNVFYDLYIAGLFSRYLTLEDYPISPGAALFRSEVLKKIEIEIYEDSFGVNVVESGIGPDMLMFLYSYLMFSNVGNYVNKKIAAFNGHNESITITSGVNKLDIHNFSALLKFFSQIPEGNEIKDYIKYMFDLLASKPKYFINANTRFDLLKNSNVYIPRTIKSSFPILGFLSYMYRKIFNSLEYRWNRFIK